MLPEPSDASDDGRDGPDASVDASSADVATRGPAVNDFDTDALHAGMRLGPYRLVRVVGRGAAATVWLADDERLARAVALKFLGSPGSDGADGAASVSVAARRRLLVEARVAAALDHPHVARVYDMGETAEGRLFIVMAYYALGSLADRLVNGPLPAADAARVAAEVAEALGAAHARGVVHRDVKPANVLFDTAGARLADFGVAAVADHQLAATRPAMQTAYLAPEQVRGEPAGPAADLWALGVTLYEMLAGRRPFDGDTPAAVLEGILATTPEPLASAAPHTPPALAALVARLLARDPNDRPASAATVARALRATLEDGVTPAARFTPDGVHVVAPHAPKQVDAPALPPDPLTALVGRSRELTEVERLLGRTRLLTLVGAGGSGKTRLAAALVSAIARRAADTPTTASARVEHAVWVDLAPVADPELLPAQIAAALRVPERAERRAAARRGRQHRRRTGAARARQLRAPRRRGDECRRRAAPPLSRAARARDEPRGVGRPWRDGVARAAALAGRGARAVRRAGASRPSRLRGHTGERRAVDEICRRLDGIPLAIELAAARARALAPAQIAARLDDAFRLLTAGSRVALPRQRTLRGTMDWSHSLLGTRDRVLLRRLAVFVGGFTLEAAEAVCGDSALGTLDAPSPAALDGDAVLDALMSLVDKSLVTMDGSGAEPRYRLLETVRQYARERLEEAGELAACETAHARHFLAVAEEAAPDLIGGESTPGLVARLVRDNDNFRAAMAWSLGSGDPLAAHPEEALRLADALLWYWYGSGGAFGTGQYRPGRAFTEAALALGDAAPPLLRARALRTIAIIDLAQGGSAAGIAAFEASLALLRGRADDGELAYMLSFYGASRLMIGDVDGATALTREAQALASPLPMGIVHSFATSWRGWVAMARGDLTEAREALEANVAGGRLTQHATTLGHSLTFIARLELVEGRTDDADAHFREGLTHHLQLNDPWGLGLDLDGLAEIALRRGQHADAARLFGGVDALRHRAGLAVLAADRADRARREAMLRDALGADFDLHYAEGSRMRPDALARLVTRA